MQDIIGKGLNREISLSVFARTYKNPSCDLQNKGWSLPVVCNLEPAKQRFPAIRLIPAVMLEPFDDEPRAIKKSCGKRSACKLVCDRGFSLLQPVALKSFCEFAVSDTGSLHLRFQIPRRLLRQFLLVRRYQGFSSFDEWRSWPDCGFRIQRAENSYFSYR